MTMRLLLVEDDAHLLGLLAQSLTEAGYDVVTAQEGKRGDALASEGGFDAIVLDWNVPGRSGVDICKRLREAGDATPVVMLTARDALEHRVFALDVGADDYLIKPFHLEELTARLRSVMRRSGIQSASTITAGTVVLDSRARTVVVGGTQVTLTSREFDILEYLERNAGIVLSRESIDSHVWGSAFEANSNVVDVFVARLRRKLGALNCDAMETLRGHGYRFNSN